MHIEVRTFLSFLLKDHCFLSQWHEIIMSRLVVIKEFSSRCAMTGVPAISAGTKESQERPVISTPVFETVVTWFRPDLMEPTHITNKKSCQWRSEVEHQVIVLVLNICFISCFSQVAKV